MSLHRFDLDEPDRVAQDQLEAESMRPVGLLGDLLFWLIALLGTALVFYLVMILTLSVALVIHKG